MASGSPTSSIYDDRVTTDLRGRAFHFDHPPRVVSLVPSLTETLFDLGAGGDVAGVTDYCIFPTELDRPRIGGTKNPRVEAIRALAPDLVYMNLEENLRRHADEIEAFAPVFVTEPKSVGDVRDLITTLGAIHERQPRAKALVSELDRACNAAAAHAPFTFACAIWKAPWMWCGGDTYVSHLAGAANGRNVLGDLMRYPTLGLETVLERKPDVVFLPDEPYPFTADDAKAIAGATAIGPFPGHLFTWHGSRTIQGLKFLANLPPP